MPSDHRLHPASLIFGVGKQLRELAWPVVAVLVTAGTAGLDWQAWLLLLLIPYSLVVFVRYATFRYRYEPREMVIRSGLFFRNERHVPYERIQNLDAVQNVLHRLLRVVEVRVQTASGQEPEATMSVVPMAAYEEMRRRVFAGREAAAGVDAVAVPAQGAGGETLLHLPPRELVLYGLIENRGAIVIAAAAGVLWELEIMDRVAGQVFGDLSFGRDEVREYVASMLGSAGALFARVAMAVAAIAALLALVRLLSVGWAIVRLHDFRLTRHGQDLRSEFGLLTRVRATIPLRRVQTVTIRRGVLHRLSGRASVRVDTAGGEGGGATAERAWLAPIVRDEAVAALVRQVLPALDLERLEWRPVHPRAVGREFRQGLVVGLLLLLPVAVWAPRAAAALAVPLAVWAYVSARQTVRHLGWAVTDEVVVFRSGWLSRRLTVASFSKVQAVALHESPFDRRHRMARLAVDTAGAGEASHRVHIPYLARPAAEELRDLVGARAAGTAFQW